MGSPVVSQGLETETATIANGASLSAAIDLRHRKLAGIQMPAAWTAANLTFEASADGVTYAPVYDNAVERTVTASTSRFIALAISDWIGVRWLKVRSGTSGAAVNQGAERAITLILQP